MRTHTLSILLGAALAVVGLSILADRPGLQTEYFALSETWKQEPVAQRVTSPRLQRADDLAPIFHWTEIFSVRWTGWLRIETSGSHRFSFFADDEAYLEIDGQRVVAGHAPVDGAPISGQIELGQGLYRIGVGLTQRADLAYLQILHAAPGEEEVELAAQRLWVSRPGPLRRLVRAIGPTDFPVVRRLLGGLLPLFGLGIFARRIELPTTRLRGLLEQRLAFQGREKVLRRLAAVGVLGVVGIATYLYLLRLAGSPLGFDDVRYMEAAIFTKGHGWMLDRFVHVYLLKAWQHLFAPDYFLAARHYWTTLATVTAVSLAAGAFALGPRLQLATMAVTLWLALAQTVVFDTAGAMWTDYTTMAFITAAVAVLLQRQKRELPPRWELHALVIGVLTLGAVRSKATGAVLLWLVLAFLWENGRVDLRLAVKKLGFWIGGFAAAQLTVMAFDARYLGDAFFAFRRHTYTAAGGVHLEYGEPEALRYGWLDQVWPRLENGAIEIFEFFPLGLLVAGALATAFVTRQRPERLVVHLLPFAFLAALLLLQTRGTYGALPRHLFPMVPTACLLGGALFHYAGIDRLGWREVATPRMLIPLGAVLLFVALLLVPAANHTVTAEELSPLAAGPEAGYGSTEEFSRHALLPASLALLALFAPFAISCPSGRVTLLFVLCLLLFADGTADTLRQRDTQRPTQRAELITYPWAVFEAPMRGASEVTISPHLFLGAQLFFGPRATAEWVARLFLQELDLQVKVRQEIGSGSDRAIGGPADLDRWERSRPGLGKTAVPEPLGRMLLVEPPATVTKDSQ